MKFTTYRSSGWIVWRRLEIVHCFVFTSFAPEGRRGSPNFLPSCTGVVDAALVKVALESVSFTQRSVELELQDRPKKMPATTRAQGLRTKLALIWPVSIFRHTIDDTSPRCGSRSPCRSLEWHPSPNSTRIGEIRVLHGNKMAGQSRIAYIIGVLYTAVYIPRPPNTCSSSFVSWNRSTHGVCVTKWISEVEPFSGEHDLQ